MDDKLGGGGGGEEVGLGKNKYRCHVFAKNNMRTMDIDCLIFVFENDREKLSTISLRLY